MEVGVCRRRPAPAFSLRVAKLGVAVAAIACIGWGTYSWSHTRHTAATPDAASRTLHTDDAARALHSPPSGRKHEQALGALAREAESLVQLIGTRVSAGGKIEVYARARLAILREAIDQLLAAPSDHADAADNKGK